MATAIIMVGVLATFERLANKKGMRYRSLNAANTSARTADTRSGSQRAASVTIADLLRNDRPWRPRPSSLRAGGKDRRRRSDRLRDRNRRRRDLIAISQHGRGIREWSSLLQLVDQADHVFV